MYSSSTHRKHRVTPIESARDELREDIKSFEEKILRAETLIEGLLGSNTHLLNEIDKKASAVLRSLRQFYEEMGRHIKEQEQEQVRAVREFQERSKA